MRTQDIEYHADGQRLVGMLAVDDAKSGKRPGVIVAHEGNGLTDHAKTSARRLAEAGFIAFALDYYGDGQPLADISQAGVGPFKADGWALLSTGDFQSVSAATNAAGAAVVFGVLADGSLWEYNPAFPGTHWQELDVGVLAAAAPRRG